MKSFWILIWCYSLFVTCKSPDKSKNDIASEVKTELTFDFEESSVDFTVKDSTGNSITFFKYQDSISYHSLRFRTSENHTQFKPTLSNFKKLWVAAQNEIDIQLTSVNVGYPLQYEDILLKHIEVFTSLDINISHDDQKIDYRLIEEIMTEKRVYPVNELLADFSYRVSGINVEKVGFVTSERLAQLGLDPSLKVPIPYMVWIKVEEI